MKTSDFYLAVYLLTMGYELIGTDRRDPSRIVFHFEGGQEDAVTFFNRDGSVEPMSFSVNIKILKKELYKYDKN